MLVQGPIILHLSLPTAPAGPPSDPPPESTTNTTTTKDCTEVDTGEVTVTYSGQIKLPEYCKEASYLLYSGQSATSTM